MRFQLKKILESETLGDIFKVLSGNILAQGIAFLTLVLISRDLGPSDYGVFSLLVAIFTFSVHISDFGVSIGYVKFVSENRNLEKEIFLTIVISKFLFAMPIVIGLILSSDFISIFFFSTNQYAKLIDFISVGVIFHSFFNLVVARFQAIQKFRSYVLLQILHNILKLGSVLLVALLYAEVKHLEYFLLCYAFSVSIIVIILVVGGGNFIKYIKNIRVSYFTHIYKCSFWVFLSSIATLIIMRLDILMLQKLSNSEYAGYYSVALNLAMVLPLITASLVATLLPKMDDFLKDRSPREYASKVLSKAKYVLLLLVLIEVSSPIIIRLLFGDDYIESIRVFQILLIAFTFGVIINPISLVMYSLNKAHLLAVVNWVQLPLNYLGNVMLIPIWHASGAATSTVILNLVGGIYIYLYVMYFAKIDSSQQEKVRALS